MNIDDLRVYNPSECAVFCKTQEKYGGNSNMCRGFPLTVNGINILSSEALYQALRFPFNPEIQKEIIAESNAMQAKMTSKHYRKEFCRDDFDKYRVTFMRWCIRVKLMQNWENFTQVLLETGDLPIVEKSSKTDDFWGAVVVKELPQPKGKGKMKLPKYPPSEQMPIGHLVGYNVMGRLNQELRENVKTGVDPLSNDFTRLDPLPIKDFLLYGELIKPIYRR